MLLGCPGPSGLRCNFLPDLRWSAPVLLEWSSASTAWGRQIAFVRRFCEEAAASVVSSGAA